MRGWRVGSLLGAVWIGTSLHGHLLGAQDTLHTRPAPVRTLQTLLDEASRLNTLPPTLLGYRADVESEMGVLLHRDDGTEFTTAMEQIASTVRWSRGGLTEQHVIGYRTRGTVVALLSTGSATGGWLTPSLYGNRLRIRTERRESGGRVLSAEDSARVARRSVRRDGSDTLPAVHPLAADRDRFYRFTGGDTIVTIQAGGRDIPIVRVQARPREGIRERVLLLDGEIDLDASSGTLVRMRGHFVRVNAGLPSSVRAIVDPVALIEYENGEFDGRYWLPTRQRIELQVSSPVLGEASAVLRIISRFSGHQIRDTAVAIANATPTVNRRRLTTAPRDSLDRYAGWQSHIGEITGSVNSDDLNDVGPDRRRPTGAPRFDLAAPRVTDALRFNRIEGVYTGIGGRLALRDAAPGVVVRATLGYAWSEETVRGRAIVERTRGVWTTELRGGRTLENTSDFRTPFDSGSTILAVFGTSDPFDYVDRQSIHAAVSRRNVRRTLQARVEGGFVDERYRPATLMHSLIFKKAYLPNRGVDEGSYVRTAALLDWSPNIAQNVLREGTSARIAYERGDGTLRFQRAEARLTHRRWFGPVLIASRADVGAVVGDRIPAQQLFEIGERQGLPGYDYKEFAGSRAAIVRTQVMYQSRYFPRPIRLPGLYTLPAIAPGASIGLQGGWTEAPTDAARAAILRLGVRDSSGVAVPVSRVTDGARATVSAGLRFFGGTTFAGFARPIDQAAKWRWVFTGAVQW